MLWLLNLCDGGNSLHDIAERSGVSFERLERVAAELEAAGVIAPAP